jgi:hypothetical protein
MKIIAEGFDLIIILHIRRILFRGFEMLNNFE